MASLFPGDNALKHEKYSVLKIQNASKSPKSRFSISPKVIKKSKKIFLFFLGKNKIKALNNFNNSKITLFECPVKIIKNNNNLWIFSDIEEII